MSALAISCRISGIAVAPPRAEMPVLATPPEILGAAIEGGFLSADQSDTWDYGGAPAVVLTREYRLVLEGIVTTGPQTDPDILVPAQSGGDSFAYQMRVTIAEGGLSSAWTILAAGSVQPALTLSQTTDGEAEMNSATGEVTVTITSPAEYAGIHVFDSGDLSAGPVNLVPPVILDDGTPAEGETLTIVPGLWVYDPDNGGTGTPSWQWQADAGGNGNFADIAGAAAASYTPSGDEAGDDLRVIETLGDGSGTRAAISAVMRVASPAEGDVARYVTRQLGASNSIAAFDVSGFSAGERLIIFHGATQLATAVTVNGNAATIHDGANFGSERRGVVASYVLQAADIAAGSVPIITNAGGQLHAFAVFHTAGGTVGDIAKGSLATSLTITPTQAQNSVIHFQWGNDARFSGTGGLVYTSGPVARLYSDFSGNAGSAAGMIQNGSTGGVTFSWTLDGSGNHAGFMIVVQRA